MIHNYKLSVSLCKSCIYPYVVSLKVVANTGSKEKVLTTSFDDKWDIVGNIAECTKRLKDPRSCNVFALLRFDSASLFFWGYHGKDVEIDQGKEHSQTILYCSFLQVPA